ncbi:phosphopantothenoylcysteine decarboxylase, putative [Plasmodium gallinaceum]|uniref:Phosphopantothenoylcysteine decarboxylase, putative n=1 Tax=Plasmodium gallinaceum TaxID=5849 RepID=A0A1J1GLQ7_PLAGA|nr:phosphopantothenoylcysteine decarboxylase, putative [Plasmodium gallinaceum]CRG93157.1 phosphopantothenoylcysteine decarboxylase, putative [Plasmodium gallinaceum]
MKILFGISGSIAAIKVNEIIEKLQEHCKTNNISIEIKYVATNIAYEKFLKPFKEKVFLDEDEWLWQKKGDAILHVELRKWADIFIICPLDANTLANISNGICSNLLTCICRCWDFKKTFLVFPCMNTYMYNHPITKEHIDIVSSWGIKVINPIEKLLACGDYGIGALPNIEDVINEIIKYLH